MKAHFILVFVSIIPWLLLYKCTTKQTTIQLAVVPYTFRGNEVQLLNQEPSSKPTPNGISTGNTTALSSRKPGLFHQSIHSNEMNDGIENQIDIKSTDIPSIDKSTEITSPSNPNHIDDTGTISANVNKPLVEGREVVGVVISNTVDNNITISSSNNAISNDSDTSTTMNGSSTDVANGINIRNNTDVDPLNFDVNSSDNNDTDDRGDDEFGLSLNSNMTSVKSTTPSIPLPFPDFEQAEVIREILNYNIDFNDTCSDSRKWDLIICTTYDNIVCLD